MDKAVFTQGFIDRLAELGKLADIQTSPAKAKGMGPVFISSGMTSGADRTSPYTEGPAEGNDSGEQDTVESGGGSEEEQQTLGDMLRFEEKLDKGEMPPDPNMPNQLDDNTHRGGRATQDYQHQQGGGSTPNRLLSSKLGHKLAASIVDAFNNTQSAKLKPQTRSRAGQYTSGRSHSVRTETTLEEELAKHSSVARVARVSLEDAPNLKGNENDVISEGTAADAIRKLYGDLGAYFGYTKKAEDEDLMDYVTKEAFLGAILGGIGRAAAMGGRAAGMAGRAAGTAAKASGRGMGRMMSPAQKAPAMAAKAKPAGGSAMQTLTGAPGPKPVAPAAQKPGGGIMANLKKNLSGGGSAGGWGMKDYMKWNVAMPMLQQKVTNVLSTPGGQKQGPYA